MKLQNALEDILVIRPNRDKLGVFLGVPLVVVLAIGAFMIFSGEVTLGGIWFLVLFGGVLVVPFAVLLAPSILFDKIIAETFTVRFFITLFVFRMKRVLYVEDIVEVVERGFVEDRGQLAKTRNTRKPFLAFRTEENEVLISKSKYKREDLERLLFRLKTINPKIIVTDAL
ncbi:MAG: hypothetical protein ACOCXQ_03120 [Patescibacteria group bacterium]